MVLTVGVIDGFDHYPAGGVGTTLGFLTAWNSSGSGFGPTASFDTGYRGRGKRLELATGLVGDARMIRTVPSSKQASMHIASSINHFDTGNVRGWMSLRDAFNAEIFMIATLPAGVLGLYNGASLLAQTPPITAGVPHRYNLTADVTDAGDSDIQLWVDGDPNKGFHYTGGDGSNSNNDIRLIGLEQWGYGAGADGGNDHSFDDLVYCYDAIQNIGELEVVTDGPTSDVVKQWTPLTGTDNFEMVNEIPPTGDTDYNFSSLVGNKDLQGFPVLPTTPDSIFCVSQIFGIRKEESGTRGFNPLINVDATDFPQATQNVATSYDWFYQHYLQNPDTLAAWLVAERAAATFGYEDAI
jgi:hypothetical protein